MQRGMSAEAKQEAIVFQREGTAAMPFRMKLLGKDPCFARAAPGAAEENRAKEAGPINPERSSTAERQNPPPRK